MPRRIPELPFRSNARDKGSLGFEILRLADLFAREARGELVSPLEVPARLGFHAVYVGLEGQGQHVVDFTRCPLGVGYLTVSAAGRVQQFLRDRSVNAWMVLFSPEFIDVGAAKVDPLRRARLLSAMWGPPALAIVGQARRDLLALCEHMHEEFRRPADGQQAALLASLVRVLLLQGERLLNEADAPAGRRTPPAPLERLFEAIEEDHAKTRSVAHYARRAGLSPRRLAELLGEHGHPNAKQLICDRVVLEQKRLLAYGEHGLKELADLTGFEDATNLVKFFRRHVGLTPIAFRRRLQTQ
jgi:AraC family transcriptional activator of pobA